MYEPFTSIEELLNPEVLSRLTGNIVNDVTCSPLSVEGSSSGSGFQSVRTDGDHAGSYILKHIPALGDWQMRTSGARVCREILTWQTGLLEQLPAEIGHAIVGCAVHDAGWAILMRDDSAGLLYPRDSQFSMVEHHRILDSMAALHAKFWGQHEVADSSIGYCDLWHRYMWLSPVAVRQEWNDSNFITKGWDRLYDLLDPGLASDIDDLHNDPQPLCNALVPFPQTVLHGDWWPANLVLHDSDPSRIILLDWAMVGPGPAGVDLARYLAGQISARYIPTSLEAAIAYYCEQLNHHLDVKLNNGEWQSMLELSLIGGFLQFGWKMLELASNEADQDKREFGLASIQWWTPHVETGLRRL
jgi:thiamine kinase-like enzyme